MKRFVLLSWMIAAAASAQTLIPTIPPRSNDTAGGQKLRWLCGSNLSSDRTFTVTPGDASRNLTLSADVSLNQSLLTTSSPTFDTLNLGTGANMVGATAALDIQAFYFQHELDGSFDNVGESTGSPPIQPYTLWFSGGPITPDDHGRGTRDLGLCYNFSAEGLISQDDAGFGMYMEDWWGPSSGDTTTTRWFEHHVSFAQEPTAQGNSQIRALDVIYPMARTTRNLGEPLIYHAGETTFQNGANTLVYMTCGAAGTEFRGPFTLTSENGATTRFIVGNTVQSNLNFDIADGSGIRSAESGSKIISYAAGSNQVDVGGTTGKNLFLYGDTIKLLPVGEWPTAVAQVDTTGLTVVKNLMRSTAAPTAAGSDQAGATALTKDFNTVAGADGNTGVRLPTAIAGMCITIKNNVAATLKVYPATGGQINALGSNNAISMGNLTCASFYASSTTQWFTCPLVP